MYEYIHNWKHNRATWKFNKVKQEKLIRDIYNKHRVSKTDFKLALEYLAGIKGSAKERFIKSAKDIIAKSKESKITEKSGESESVDQDMINGQVDQNNEQTDKDIEQNLSTQRKRAKKIVKLFKD